MALGSFSTFCDLEPDVMAVASKFSNIFFCHVHGETLPRLVSVRLPASSQHVAIPKQTRSYVGYDAVSLGR